MAAIAEAPADADAVRSERDRIRAHLHLTKIRAGSWALVIAALMDVVSLVTMEGAAPAMRVTYVGMVALYSFQYVAIRLPRIRRFGPTGTRFLTFILWSITAGLLIRTALALFEPDTVTAVGDGALSVFAGLIVVYLLAFTLLDDTRPAIATSLVVLAISVGLVVARVAGDPTATLVVEGRPYLRTFAVHVIILVLLYVLAVTKEHIDDSETAATALTVVAGTDELTGLANRRHLTSALQREVARAEREEVPFSVLLLDIDHFKAVNDTYGHAVGDAVIQRCATVLADTTRGADLAGRWGGEEFLVVAPGADVDAARNLAERCRSRLRDDDFPTVGTVTASFGVATWEAGDTADSVVDRADRALYRAKAGGRDRVEA